MNREMADEGITDLLEYVGSRSDAAFSRIVHRYIGLVHSTALRRVGDQHLAQDITQAVFIILAQKASSLRPDAILPAWLYRTTLFAAADALKIKRRRERREHQAYMQATLNDAAAHDWPSIAPLLDEGMSRLNESDRAALILRYFENKQTRDVAQALRTSEEAAQKRITRALQKLRTIFAKRGITLTGTAIAAGISANAVQVAPQGLAAVASAAVGAATSASAAIATTSVIAITVIQKATVAATIAILAASALYQSSRSLRYQGELRALRQSQQSRGLSANAAFGSTNQAALIAALSDENAKLKENFSELLRLRGEVTRLRTEFNILSKTNVENSTLQAWSAKAGQLKQYVAQHPELVPPEFQFLTEREWLVIAADEPDGNQFQTEAEYRRAVDELGRQSESNFGNLIQAALRKFMSSNEHRFPTSVTDLQPYIDQTAFAILTDQYEIKSSQIFPEALRKEYGINGDWVITRKKGINDQPDRGSPSRLAVHSNGNAYWQTTWPTAKVK